MIPIRFVLQFLFEHSFKYNIIIVCIVSSSISRNRHSLGILETFYLLQLLLTFSLASWEDTFTSKVT